MVENKRQKYLVKYTANASVVIFLVFSCGSVPALPKWYLKAVVPFHVHLLVVLFTSINLCNKQQQFVSFSQHPKDYKFLLHSLLLKFVKLVTLFSIFFRLLQLLILQEVLEIKNIKKNISELEKYIQINSKITIPHTTSLLHTFHNFHQLFYFFPLQDSNSRSLDCHSSAVSILPPFLSYEIRSFTTALN